MTLTEIITYTLFEWYIFSQLLEFMALGRRRKLLVRQGRFYDKYDNLGQRLLSKSLVLQAEELIAEAALGIEREEWGGLIEERVSAIEHCAALWKLDRQDIEGHLNFTTKYLEGLQAVHPFAKEFDALTEEWRTILSDRERIEDVPSGQKRMDEMKVLQEVFHPDLMMIERIHDLKQKLARELQSRS